MEQKNKKILAVVIVLLVIIAFGLVMVVVKKDKKPVVSQKVEPIKTEEVKEVEDNGTSPLTEEKKAQVAAIRNITGKITAIEVDSISVTPTTGEKLILKVPKEGANFSSLTKQADGSFMVKEIGLFDIPKDKEVEIQYNSTTNELTMVGVR